MEYIGHINAEGGSLLLIDGGIASFWKGSNGEDYARACNLFDATAGLEGAEITVGTGKGILWEMEGPGTAAVFKEHETHYIVVRPWPNDPTDSESSRTMAQRPQGGSTEIGTLKVESGILVILWAAEDSSCVQSLEIPSSSGRPAGKMALEDAALILRSPTKVFRCFHDRVETSAGVGRRLHLLA